MIRPAFYFEIASRNSADWLLERDAYDSFNPRWFEILVEFPHLLSEFRADEIETLRNVLKGKDLSFHGATLNFSLLALNKAIVAETTRVLLDQIDLAKLLGCNMFTFHAGEYPYFYERVAPSLHEALAISVGKLVEYADSVGCQLCIENLKNKNSYPRTIIELENTFSVLPDIGFALDVRHACVVGESPVELARMFGSRLRSVHFRSDCGMSTAQLEAFLQTLHDVNFDGPFIIEDRSLNELDKSARDMLYQARSMLASFLQF